MEKDIIIELFGELLGELQKLDPTKPWGMYWKTIYQALDTCSNADYEERMKLN